MKNNRMVEQQNSKRELYQCLHSWHRQKQFIIIDKILQKTIQPSLQKFVEHNAIQHYETAEHEHFEQHLSSF